MKLMMKALFLSAIVRNYGDLFLKLCLTTGSEVTEDIFFFAHRETAMGKKSHTLGDGYECNMVDRGLNKWQCHLPDRADGFRLPSSPGKRKNNQISVFSVSLW